MECRVIEIVRNGRRHHIVIGEVVMFHFNDGIADAACNVDLNALQPIGRLSGQRYARIHDVFALERRFIGEKPKQLG
jgi:flavin reductase (DIM6/NTAB) family NADH-FMN oxidoreductase RutF